MAKDECELLCNGCGHTWIKLRKNIKKNGWPKNCPNCGSSNFECGCGCTITTGCKCDDCGCGDGSCATNKNKKKDSCGDCSSDHCGKKKR